MNWRHVRVPAPTSRVVPVCVYVKGSTADTVIESIRDHAWHEVGPDMHDAYGVYSIDLVYPARSRPGATLRWYSTYEPSLSFVIVLYTTASAVRVSRVVYI
jgi:hypothetical protein